MQTFYSAVSLRFILVLSVISALFLAPVGTFAQKRRVSANSSRAESNRKNVKQPKLSKQAYRKMPPSMRLSPQQSPDEYVQGIVWQGDPGVTKSVAQIMQDDALYQAKLTPQQRAELAEKREEKNERNEFKLKKSRKNSPAALQYDENGAWVNPLERESSLVSRKPSNSFTGPLNPQTVASTFSGPDASVGGGFVPPDTQGDVGQSDVLMTANDRITSYTKAGVTGGLNSSTTTFWTPTGATGPCDNHVRYDRLSKRWFVVAIDCDPAGSNKILIAVSSGSTITNASSFTFYNFVNDTVGTTPNTDTGGFADYPTLGVDKNALYIGDNVFSAAGAFIGCSAFVINKANMIAGTLTVTAFRNVGTTTTGIYTPQGVDNEDPSATVGYLIGSDTNAFNRLNIRKITTPGGVPAISGNLPITVSSGDGILVPNQGQTNTNYRLDYLDDRPYAAMINVNRVLTSARQDVASLWTSHSFGMAATAPFAPSTTGVMGSRWFEINTDPASPALRQSGTFIDPANFVWIGSNAMSGQGFMTIGASRSSLTMFPGTVVAGRLREDSPTGADALGVTEALSSAFAGQARYINQNLSQAANTGRRWGDYSQTSVDPNDDQTMWSFQEYSDASGNWHERAIKLQAPPPAAPKACTAATTVQLDVANAFHGVITVTGTSTAGSEFYDGNVVDWSAFRDYANYADNTGTAVSYTHGGGPGFHGPGAINSAGNGHLTAVSGAATTGSGTASVAAFAPNAPGNSTIYQSPTTFKIKLDITGATGSSKFPLTITNPDGQTITTTDAICTLVPVAASTSINGRVLTRAGRGIGGATVSLLNVATNQTRTVRTNTFGYYRLDNVEVGRSYLLSANAKGYTFGGGQLINLTEEIGGINIIANR